MKEATRRWLKAWKNIGLYTFIVIAGIPTFGLAWIYCNERLQSWSKEEDWRLSAIHALEMWLHFWRGVLLFFAGFPTLGYTWSLMVHLEEPCFGGLRRKYQTTES